MLFGISTVSHEEKNEARGDHTSWDYGGVNSWPLEAAPPYAAVPSDGGPFFDQPRSRTDVSSQPQPDTLERTIKWWPIP